MYRAQVSDATTKKPILKKCPFCGCRVMIGKGKRYKADSQPGSILPHKAGDWFWKPSLNHRCGMKDHRESYMSISIGGDSVEQIAERWNTRAGE